MEQFFGTSSNGKALNKELENACENFLKTKSNVEPVKITKDAVNIDSLSPEQLQLTLNHLEIEVRTLYCIVFQVMF